MANLMNYIKNYKDKVFDEVPFNEIDNLVFCELTYLNYDGIIPEDRNTITLKEVGEIYLKNNKYKDVKKIGIAQKDAYLLLKELINTKRYQEVLLSNYSYVGNKSIQFSAMTFRYKKKFIYVAYEGTDDLISGWKENFNIAYMFPTISHTYAINYLNKVIKLFDRNIIVGGHSKGGNLALVASMYCKRRIRRKIKQVYSNDGPGLRKKEIESKEYKKIRDRYIHIVPNYSYFGVLLRHDKYKVIKSNKKDIMAHSIMSWQIEDNKLVSSNLSTISKNLEKGLIIWLDNNDDKKRKKLITTIFKAIEDTGIETVSSLTKLKNVITVIKKIKNIDDETKKIAIDLLKFNTNYIIENRKNND